MRLLLDSHAFLWWIGDSPRLSRTVRELLASRETQGVVSVATAWELAIKTAKGRFTPHVDLAFLLEEHVALNGFEVLPIGLAHALQVRVLPHHHGDPFDRLLVAQAQVENVPLVTCDPRIGRYAVETLW